MIRGRDIMPLTPSFLVAAASALIGVRATDAPRRGGMVERFRALTGAPPGQPWDTAFVSYAGYWSHFDHFRGEPRWPLPLTWDCGLLGYIAGTRGVLAEDPLPGDVFLEAGQVAGVFVRAGIVVKSREEEDENGHVAHVCTTIEVGVGRLPARRGATVLRRERALLPHRGDRCVRWVDLDTRAWQDGRINTYMGAAA